MKFILPITLLFIVHATNAQEQRNLKRGNLAAEGYDVVAYFGGEAKEGSSNFESTYKGAKYLFTNESNKEKFVSNPAMYAPQYGGWCAYAMGVDGSKVKIDPETYKILDNKLYLFYNFWGTNTLTSWNEKENDLKASADKYWGEIVK